MHCELPVRVTPRSSRNKLSPNADGSLKIWVTASPTDGQANDAVCDLLSEALGIAKGRVSIIRGQTGRSKVVHIDGLTLDECITRLNALAP